MEIGLYTFGDAGRSRAADTTITPEMRLRHLVEEIELADQVGLDVFELGEHHRADYAVSAPAVALAAAETRTRSIRLTSAVTVLSSDDPIRVFQQYSTLDNLSNGRAEVMVGRSSFIERFPLFSLDLDDYDALFIEKLEKLLAANDAEVLDWPGTAHTAPVPHRGVYPCAMQEILPIWIAVGGTPDSVVRAGRMGLLLALGIIGGQPARFAPLFDLYRRAAAQAGHEPGRLATSLNLHGLVADTCECALECFAPAYAEVMTRLGSERGWAPMTRPQVEAAAAPGGSLFLGSPDEVVEKILAAHEIFGFSRVLLQMAIGAVDYRALMRAIELFKIRVAPELRKALA